MVIREALLAEHSKRQTMNELQLIVDKHAPHTTIAFRKRAGMVLPKA